MSEFEKDPDAVRFYSWDLTSYLASRPGQPVTLTAATVLDVEGLTIDQTTYDGTSVTCRIAGGTVGTLYTVTARLTLSNGETDDRSITIYIAEQ